MVSWRGEGSGPVVVQLSIPGGVQLIYSSVLGFRALILCYSVMTIAVSVFIFFFYRPVGEAAQPEEKTGAVVKDIITVVKMPGVWILSLIIFSSYIMYTAQSYITPYLTEMFGQSDRRLRSSV